MKKIILFLGVLLFSLVAVGCGKNEESTGEVEINANPTRYADCFYRTKTKIKFRN